MVEFNEGFRDNDTLPAGECTAKCNSKGPGSCLFGAYSWPNKIVESKDECLGKGIILPAVQVGVHNISQALLTKFEHNPHQQANNHLGRSQAVTSFAKSVHGKCRRLIYNELLRMDLLLVFLVHTLQPRH